MAEKDPRTKLSKLLSLVLRHQPEHIGLALDDEGWADVNSLIERANAHGASLNHELLEELVRDNDKQRFILSADGSRIRANQGHSVQVDLGLSPAEPPSILFHGTADRNLASIETRGLLKGERHHVHLSAEETTARNVGKRYGRPIVLRVDAAAMHAGGHVFFRSANGVWLTEHVPAEFLRR